MYIKFKKTRKISNQFFDVTYNSISVKKMRQNKKVERIAATTTENRNERLRLCFYDNHPSSCMVTAWNRNGGGGAWQKIVQCNNIPQKILGSAFLFQCIGSSGRRRVYILNCSFFSFYVYKTFWLMLISSFVRVEEGGLAYRIPFFSFLQLSFYEQ